MNVVGVRWKGSDGEEEEEGESRGTPHTRESTTHYVKKDVYVCLTFPCSPLFPEYVTHM